MSGREDESHMVGLGGALFYFYCVSVVRTLCVQ